jgi:Response regulator containing CheY-like receiver domain and AraC-type DNA-binding domain
MLKVIIVDDEHKVCQLIKLLVDWEKLGLELVEEINDGKKALEIIKKIKPDIVITDIRMPGIDGIELVKKTRELDISSSFVIISGYANFEYAQSAIKYGVVDYILKPINGEELTQILTKISYNKNIQNEQKEIEYKTKVNLETSRNKLRIQFINLLVSGYPIKNNSIEAANSEYQFLFHDGTFLVLIIKLDLKKDISFDEKQESIILEIVREKIQSKFKDICYDLECQKYNYNVVGILNFDPINKTAIQNTIKSIFEELKNYLDKFNDFYITIGQGNSMEKIDLLHESYKQANSFIYARLLVGLGRIIDRASIDNYYKIDLKKIFTLEKEKQLETLIGLFDYIKISEFVEECFSGNILYFKIDPGLIQKLVFKIIDIFINTTKNLDSNFNNEEKLPKLYEAVENSITLNQISSRLLKFIKEYLDTYLEFKNTKDSMPVNLAKQYISEHYSETITLEDISNIVHLNPVYFSIIFKKQCAMNFSEYLINYRLDIAKELLKDFDNNISEVANMVGYSDANYFSKLFKKIVGINPSQYRDLYL